MVREATCKECGNYETVAHKVSPGFDPHAPLNRDIHLF